MCRELLEGVLASDDRSNAYNPQRWRRLADLCIQQGRVAEAQLCAQSAGDLSLSLLLLSCIGDKTGLYEVAKQAQQQPGKRICGLTNILLLSCLRIRRTLVHISLGWKPHKNWKRL